EEYEDKLQLFQKFKNRQEITNKLLSCLNDEQSSKEDLIPLIELLKQE
ncbi:MAG: hypothetical protein RR603_05750, partial [Kurthia sp.]